MNFTPPGYPPAGFAPNPQQGQAPPQAPAQGYQYPPSGAPQQGYAPPGAPSYSGPPQGAPQGYGQPQQQGYAPPQPPQAPQGYGAPQGYQPPPGYAPPQGGGLPNFAGADATELSMRTDGIPLGDHHLRCKGSLVTDTLLILTFEVKQSSTLAPGAIVAFKQNRTVSAQNGGDKTRDAACLACILPLAGWSVEDTPESKAKIAALGAQGYKSRVLAEVFGQGTLEGRPLDQFEVYCKGTPKAANPRKPADPTKPPWPNLKFIPVQPR
jgi:hypothetical protein